MKDIRNTIAHEYIEENLSEIFVDVLKYSENLLGIIDNTIGYVDRLKIQ
ncbi:MAG: capsule biosynthesis protein [Gammaproteobacteria bacterium]|nr:MAG: capsule biosynthesis protein [Gammaproteobacteria bacterium]